MKHNKFFLALLSAMPLFSFAQTDNTIDEVVWVVGDEAILRSDVEDERMAMQRFHPSDENPYCAIPEQIAIRKLFLNQAKLDSVEVPMSRVNDMAERRINDLIDNMGSEAKVEEYSNRSIRELRELFREQYMEQAKVQMVQSNLVKNIKVTPADVRQYFKHLPEDSVPMIPTTVEVEILTLEPRVPQEEVDAVKNQLRDFTDKINKGESSFSSLAILYSDDKGSSRKGGELDYMSRGELVPEFASVAFNLTDPTKISKIVKTEFGYHIIQLIDRKGDKIKVRHILRKPVIPASAFTDATNHLDSVLVAINDGKFTFEEAAAVISDDKDTRNNRGLMQNKNTLSSEFEMQDLPSEIQRQVRQLQVGEISKPFTMVNEKDQEVCAIIKLKSRVERHRASMADDFQVLRNVVQSKLSERRINQWITDKIKNTYVRINDGWQSCKFTYPGWIKK